MAKDDQNMDPNTAKPLRGLLTLAVLPLFLIAIAGVAIYLNLSESRKLEAHQHSKSVSKLLASQADGFIRNRAHSVALMAGEQSLIAYLRSTNFDRRGVSQKLQHYCHTLEASICYIMDRKGLAIADNRIGPDTLVGNNYAFRPYFQQAIQGIPAVHLALGVTTKKRGIYFSHPIGADLRNPIGVAVIKFSPSQIEERFKHIPGNASLTDPNGVVFSANNKQWLYKTLFPLSTVQQKEVVSSRQFGDEAPAHIGFKNSFNDEVEGQNGQIYIYEETPLETLPGWNISVFLTPDQFHTTEQITRHQFILTLIGLLFLLTLASIGLLYRQLQKSFSSISHYQQELEQSENRLQRFEQVSAEAILVYNDQGIVDLNKRAEELFGYSYDDFMRLGITSLFNAETLPLAKAHVKDNIEQPYQAVILTKDNAEIPVVVTGRNASWRGDPVRVASFCDIRQQIEVQKRLTASEGRFRQLSDLVTEGLLIYSNRTILDVNQSLCQIFSIERNTLLSAPLSELFSNEIADKIKAQIQGEALQLKLLRTDGTSFPAEIVCDSMQFDDGIFSIVAIRDISRQKEQEEHILYQAQYDLLTHIPNRFLARDRAEQAIKKLRHSEKKLALMFIDLDDFKKVNDSLGHDMGDQLLQEAVKRFQSCLSHEHSLARHGGDEFIIMLEDLGKPEQAEIVAESILEKFSRPFSIQGQQLLVTTSIGISIFPDDANDYPALLRAADIGMYKAKNEGRNTFHYYTQEMNDVATRQLELDNCLRTAIANDEFSLAFQPLICGVREHNEVVGAEVLLRWNSAKLGAVSPAEFIPLTEQTGLIVPIGRWLLKQACNQAQAWIEQGHTSFTISINVSPRQFKGNDFISDLEQALSLSGLAPEQLKLEVTEGLLIEASPELTSTLEAISAMGIQISMDDFGTGYSSLNYLQKFPFDNLKIDRSFINELPEHAESQILVSATIAMAHQLGLSVTAEGIETKAQKEYLRQLRCDYLQGYLLGKPMPATEFSSILNENNSCH